MTDYVLEKVLEYQRQCLLVGRGHYLAAESGMAMHRLLGVPVVIGSTALASSIAVKWDASGNRTATVIMGVGAAVVAVLAALQTFLGFADRASAHRAAGVSYGEIRRRLDILLLQIRAEPLGTGQTLPGKAYVENLSDLTERLGDLASTSPHLPAKWYERAKKEQGMS